MKIDAIDIFHVRMPLVEPWHTAYGSDDAIESIILRMRSAGVEGWGESCPLALPCYSSEYASGAFGVLRNCFAACLIGQDIRTGEDLQQRLQLFKGNWFAKAALDTAWWDLYARSLGQPLYRVLGGSRSTISAGADFGIQKSVENLVDLVGAAVQSGAPRIKLKYSPQWGFPVVEKIRRSFPDAILHIDCNAAYSLLDQPMFQNLDSLNLAMFEQPLNSNDIVDHATLQSGVKTSICLDESINSVHSMKEAIALKSCRWVNIKPGRVGGVTIARQIHDLCQSVNIPCWVGGMLESTIGAMHCASLATLPNFRYPADLFPSTRFYTSDLAEPPLHFSKPWQFSLPDSPGIGVVPNQARLKKNLLQQANFRA